MFNVFTSRMCSRPNIALSGHLYYINWFSFASHLQYKNSAAAVFGGFVVRILLSLYHTCLISCSTSPTDVWTGFTTGNGGRISGSHVCSVIEYAPHASWYAVAPRGQKRRHILPQPPRPTWANAYVQALAATATRRGMLQWSTGYSPLTSVP